MRPDNSNKQDVIDALLESSWENPPAHLEQRLMAIPTQTVLAQKHQLDRISFFLNGILMLWGVVMAIYFWTPLNGMLASLSQGVLGFSTFTPQLLMHPIVGLIALACLLFGWVWMDMEKHPGVTKV